MVNFHITHLTVYQHVLVLFLSVVSTSATSTTPLPDCSEANPSKKCVKTTLLLNGSSQESLQSHWLFARVLIKRGKKKVKVLKNCKQKFYKILQCIFSILFITNFWPHRVACRS